MLKIEEQRLMTTVDSLKEAIIAIDGNYRVLRINKTARTLLNLPDEMNVLNVDVNTLCNISSKNTPSYLKQNIDIALQTGKPQWSDRLTYLVTSNPDIRKHHSDQAKDRSQRSRSRLPKHP